MYTQIPQAKLPLKQSIHRPKKKKKKSLTPPDIAGQVIISYRAKAGTPILLQLSLYKIKHTPAI